jgi:hypothetical protein
MNRSRCEKEPDVNTELLVCLPFFSAGYAIRTDSCF